MKSTGSVVRKVPNSVTVFALITIFIFLIISFHSLTLKEFEIGVDMGKQIYQIENIFDYHIENGNLSDELTYKYKNAKDIFDSSLQDYDAINQYHETLFELYRQIPNTSRPTIAA